MILETLPFTEIVSRTGGAFFRALCFHFPDPPPRFLLLYRMPGEEGFRPTLWMAAGSEADMAAFHDACSARIADLLLQPRN